MGQTSTKFPKEHRQVSSRCPSGAGFAGSSDLTALPDPLIPRLPVSRRPPRFFLSHWRGNAAAVVGLQRMLQYRGLHAWRDVDDLEIGLPFEVEIRAAIRTEVSAFIAYVTPEFLTRDIIWGVEVPESLERVRREPGFLIIPLFCGVSPEALSAVCARHGLDDLSAFNGHTISSGTRRSRARDAELRLVSQRVLRASLKPLFAADPDYVPRLLLRAQAHTPAAPGVDLDLDWVQPFATGCPSPDEWSDQLLPALSDLREALGGMSRRHLHVEVQAPLSAPLALGEVFSATAKYILTFGGTNGAWSTTALRRETPVLVRRDVAASGRDPSVAIVEVSVARDIGVSVADHARNLEGPTPGRAVRLEPAVGPSGSVVHDDSWAISAAWQVGDCLRALHDEGVRHIHLFVAAPAEWCVLLGHTFNAVGCITVHQFSPATSGYVRACAIGAVEASAQGG